MSFATILYYFVLSIIWIKLNLGILFVILHCEILFKDNQTNIMIDLSSVESPKDLFLLNCRIFILGE